MLWLLNKPKVYLLSMGEAEWYFTHKDEVIDKSEIALKVRLQNKGFEGTSISAVFEAKLPNQERGIFHSVNNFEMSGQGKIQEPTMILDLPIVEGQPVKGNTLSGKLKLEALGNRRLLLGKKYLIKSLDIPYSEHMPVERAL